MRPQFTLGNADLFSALLLESSELLIGANRWLLSSVVLVRCYAVARVF